MEKAKFDTDFKKNNKKVDKKNEEVENFWTL